MINIIIELIQLLPTILGISIFVSTEHITRIMILMYCYTYLPM